MHNYIYLLREREFIESNLNIYKIGKSTQENIKRFKQYPKNSELILQIECENCSVYEKDLINLFSLKYIKRTDLGLEYFEGNKDEMKIDIIKLTMNVDIISSNVKPDIPQKTIDTTDKGHYFIINCEYNETKWNTIINLKNNKLIEYIHACYDNNITAFIKCYSRKSVSYIKKVININDISIQNAYNDVIFNLIKNGNNYYKYISTNEEFIDAEHSRALTYSLYIDKYTDSKWSMLKEISKQKGIVYFCASITPDKEITAFVRFVHNKTQSAVNTLFNNEVIAVSVSRADKQIVDEIKKGNNYFEHSIKPNKLLNSDILNLVINTIASDKKTNECFQKLVEYNNNKQLHNPSV